MCNMEGAFVTFVMAVVLYIFCHEAFFRSNGGDKSTISK